MKSNLIKIIAGLGFSFSFILCLYACQAEAPNGGVHGGFDPNNQDQLVEIYVKTNFFNDFSVYEKYGLEGKKGLHYTETIVGLTRSTKDWQNFLNRVDQYRKKLEEENFTPPK